MPEQSRAAGSPRESLLSLFREFERYRNDIAVIQKRGYRRETWTYGKLADAAKSCAISLKEHGVGTGDRVLLWTPNSAEWVAAFWGCLLLGAVVVPMDEGANADFVSRVARDAGIILAVASRDKMLGEQRACGSIVKVIDVDELAGDSLGQGQQENFASGRARNYPDYETFSNVRITRDHIAQILFTSGTTSEPRGVVLTHGNFLANLQPVEVGISSYRKYERWFHPLRFVTLVPLSHVFGQFMALFVPPLLGAGIVFESSNNAAEIMRSLKRERAIALVAVPRMVEALRSGIEREFVTRGRQERFAREFKAAEGKKFLRRVWIFRSIHHRLGWKFSAIISGGAALAPRDEEFFARIGYAVIQGYGMTETASLISLNHPFRVAAGTIGKVLPGREFRLAEDGEILVRGENVSAGYWEAGALRQTQNAGWLHTGDIGELDSEGNLHFRGRKKNVMVTPAGLNVYPEDLEAALKKQPGVRDCVVLPIERNGNAEPCAVLLLDPDAMAESASGAVPEESQKFRSERIASLAVENANRTLAEYQHINTWVLWAGAGFPRTSTGKPRLALISTQVLEYLGAMDDPGDTSGISELSSSSDEGLDQLVRRFAPNSPRRSASAKALESGLGLTSLDRVELMSALEEKYQVELDETAFSNAKSVADIRRLLKQPSSQRTQDSYPRWAQTWPIRLVRLVAYYALVWPSTLLLAYPKVIGGENLRSERGPLLVVSNHVTRRADIGLILAALPRRYRENLATAMGGETLQHLRQPPRDWIFFKRWGYQLGYRLVTALFNVFPLPQRSGFRESFQFAGESADRGYSILVFPEGEVTRDGNIAVFQEGIGLLAQNLALPVIPMRLDGVWQMKSEHRRWAGRGEITVRIGAPVTFPAGTDPGSIARQLHALVEAL
ncbi:MAG: long-chain acyl-CoA synthetase [Acidobacteriaceae bacterium]|nr:long-chain acyl-CoA synthetase [Acidobacteriaceae bacterium]